MKIKCFRSNELCDFAIAITPIVHLMWNKDFKFGKTRKLYWLTIGWLLWSVEFQWEKERRGL